MAMTTGAAFGSRPFFWWGGENLQELVDADGGLIRRIFEDVTEESAHWRGEHSMADGSTRQPDAEFDPAGAKDTSARETRHEPVNPPLDRGMAATRWPRRSQWYIHPFKPRSTASWGAGANAFCQPCLLSLKYRGGVQCDESF